jgi:hypothetical protein
MSRTFLIAASLVVLVLAAAACQAPVAPGTPTPAPTPVIAADSAQAGIKQAWEKSSHAASFVSADDGSNNVCARCHSPHNWTPTDPADMPATCASCKFTIKTPKPIAQADWKAIPCEMCHRVENNVLVAKVAYLNTAIAQFETDTDPYEDVASNRELCEKCHRNAGGFSYKVDMGSGPHSSFDCTRCHNPHGIAATCSNAGCHADVLKPSTPIAGHDAAHAAVNCTACHDAAGLKVGPTDGKKAWSAFRSVAPGGKAGQSAYVSHNLQRKVDCLRCHYSKNPWGLSESVKAQ